MVKLVQLRFGICAALLLMLGFVWVPSTVNAASEDPQSVPSGPTASQSQYGYNREGNSQDNKERNSQDNKERNSQDNKERNGQDNKERNGQDNKERNGEYNETNNRSGACASIHRVGLGENLSWIAAGYGLSVDDLASENNLDDTDLIYENQALCIPINSSGPSSNSQTDDKYTSPSRSSEYNNQDNGYGHQDDGYGQPGKAYDPSKDYGDQSKDYGDQSKDYGDQSKDYGDQSKDYGDQSKDYGDQSKDYGDQSKGYDDQSKGYDDQSNGYDELQPGQSRWGTE